MIRKIKILLLFVFIMFLITSCNKKENSKNNSDVVSKTESSESEKKDESAENISTGENKNKDLDEDSQIDTNTTISTNKDANSSGNVDESKTVAQIEKIIFSQNEMTLSPNDSQVLSVSLVPNVAQQGTLVWSSSDESVAKYQGGQIIAQAKGDCIITATAPNGVSASCRVIVRSKVVNSGKCGDNITWTYYEDYSLVFSGSGDMYEYYDDVWYTLGNVLIPWYSYSPQVQEIVVEEGITSICSFAFLDAYVCTRVSIPESIRYIGHCAFEHCNSMKYVILNKSLQNIGCMVFHSDNFNVFYKGTESDFLNIKTVIPPGATDDRWSQKKYRWDGEFKGNLLYYSEHQRNGCWHYVNGIPTIW